jgi:hypothetical protein
MIVRGGCLMSDPFIVGYPTPVDTRLESWLYITNRGDREYGNEYFCFRLVLSEELS